LQLRKKEILPLIELALEEDRVKEDITSQLLIPPSLLAEAEVVAKEKGIIAGLSVLRWVFQTVDPKIQIRFLVKEGQFVSSGQKIVYLKGKAQNLLAGERTALNFLQHLSGIASTVKKYLAAVNPFSVKIMDTRKTIPGLRVLEKYAVTVGGGFNHRRNLKEQVLIKNNHLSLKGGLKKTLSSLTRIKKMVELEVRNLEEFRQALSSPRVKIIMLDNMSLKEIQKAVSLNKACGKKKILEVSGGINLGRIKKIASTGVERISIGALTHSAPALDICMRIKPISSKTLSMSPKK
jgi:nicotinate-nucleotide pyrophosphorylase (carboxylating)